MSIITKLISWYHRWLVRKLSAIATALYPDMEERASAFFGEGFELQSIIQTNEGRVLDSILISMEDDGSIFISVVNKDEVEIDE